MWSDPGTHPLPVADPDVDVYCLTHNETSTGVAMPIERVDGPTTGRSCSSTPRRRPAGCGSTSPSATCTTSPRRSASPPTAGCGWRACRRPPSSASSGSRASGRWCPAFLDLRIALEQQPARPDVQHARPGHDPAGQGAGRVDQRQRRAGVGGRAVRRRRRRRSTAGPTPTSWRRRSWPTRTMRSPVVATIDLDERFDAVRRVAGAAGQRHRRHRVVPQARPQPAPHRPVPGHRPRRRRPAHQVHRPRPQPALA